MTAAASSPRFSLFLNAILWQIHLLSDLHVSIGTAKDERKEATKLKYAVKQSTTMKPLPHRAAAQHVVLTDSAVFHLELKMVALDVSDVMHFIWNKKNNSIVYVI